MYVVLAGSYKALMYFNNHNIGIILNKYFKYRNWHIDVSIQTSVPQITYRQILKVSRSSSAS